MKNKKTVHEWLDNLDKTIWSRSRAIIILDADKNYVGKIQVAYPKDGAGMLRAFLWDFGNDIQMGTARGYGRDKLSAALRGMTFRGIVLQDHPENWEIQLRQAKYQVIIVM